MKTITETATALNAFGKKLPTPLEYSWTYDAYENYAEIVAAKDEFSEAQLVDLSNAKRNANARSKSYNAALDAAGIIRPTAENDSQVALKDMYRTLSVQKLPDGTPKFTHQQARERAANALGLEWAEE